MSLSSAFRGNAVITVRTAYVLLVLVIYVRPIIQRHSAGPIFTKIAGLIELWP